MKNNNTGSQRKYVPCIKKTRHLHKEWSSIFLAILGLDQVKEDSLDSVTESSRPPPTKNIKTFKLRFAPLKIFLSICYLYSPSLGKIVLPKKSLAIIVCTLNIRISIENIENANVFMYMTFWHFWFQTQSNMYSMIGNLKYKLFSLATINAQ